MNDFEFDLPLPKSHKNLLIDLVKMARKHSVLSLHYFCSTNIKGECGIDTGFDDNDRIDLRLPEDPALAFELLEFLKYDQEKYIVTLLPRALKWADYKNKNWFLKFLTRLPGTVKDFMIFVAFILSLALTVLQIFQSLKPAP